MSNYQFTVEGKSGSTGFSIYILYKAEEKLVTLTFSTASISPPPHYLLKDDGWVHLFCLMTGKWSPLKAQMYSFSRLIMVKAFYIYTLYMYIYNNTEAVTTDTALSYNNLIILCIINCIAITPLRSIMICFTFVSHSAAQLFSTQISCFAIGVGMKPSLNTIYVIHSY